MVDGRENTPGSADHASPARINMRGGMTATAVPAHGTLFINTNTELFALSNRAGASR